MSGGDVPERPTYLGSGRFDDLARMITELMSELWILKDRNMVLEKLLDDAGVVTTAAIDEYVPDHDTSVVLAAERAAFTARILGAVLPQDERLARELGTVAG